MITRKPVGVAKETRSRMRMVRAGTLVTFVLVIGGCGGDATVAGQVAIIR